MPACCHRLIPAILALAPAIAFVACTSGGSGRESEWSSKSGASASQASGLQFASPEAAVDALITAVRAQDRAALKRIFGPDIARLQSGENRQDNLDFQRFVAAYDIAHSIRDNTDDSYSLVMGEQEWVFPAPIIYNGTRWQFDTNAGIDEIITRTIGRNELSVIDACASIVAAQQQYFEMDPDGDGVKTYAAKLRSDVGQRNGLYWPDSPGAPASPLGPVVKQAAAEGDLSIESTGRQPYQGYYFRVLTSQVPGAPGGAMKYGDADGRMTRGHAMIAWPAAYDETGVMSFIVSRDGTVHQKDLGEHSEAVAASIASFDPTGWEAVSE